MHFLIVDDDVFSRGGMALTLRSVYPGCRVDEVRSVSGAIELLSQHRAIDLVLLDLLVDDSRGLQTLTTLKQWCEEQDCNPRIVIVSGGADYDDSLIPDAIERSATGFITKGIQEEIFRSAIELTLAGSIFIPERYLRARRQALPTKGRPSAENFTPREQQVASLLIQGLTYKQIAKRLGSTDESGRGMSDHTVRVHVQRMAWKLRLADGVQSDGLSAKAAVLTAFAEQRLQFRTGPNDKER